MKHGHPGFARKCAPRGDSLALGPRRCNEESGRHANRIDAADHRSVEQGAGDRPFRLAADPVAGLVVELADEIDERVRVDVLEGALRPFIAAHAHGKAVEIKARRIDVGDVEGGAAEDRRRHDAMPVDVEAIRRRAGFDVDRDLLNRGRDRKVVEEAFAGIRAAQRGNGDGSIDTVGIVAWIVRVGEAERKVFAEFAPSVILMSNRPVASVIFTSIW